MDPRRHEVVAEEFIHLGNRGHLAGVAVVEAVDPLGEGRTAGRLHGPSDVLAGRLKLGSIPRRLLLPLDSGPMIVQLQANVVQHAPRSVAGIPRR